MLVFNSLPPLNMALNKAFIGSKTGFIACPTILNMWKTPVNTFFILLADSSLRIRFSDSSLIFSVISYHPDEVIDGKTSSNASFTLPRILAKYSQRLLNAVNRFRYPDILSRLSLSSIKSKICFLISSSPPDISSRNLLISSLFFSIASAFFSRDLVFFSTDSASSSSSFSSSSLVAASSLSLAIRSVKIFTFSLDAPVRLET